MFTFVFNSVLLGVGLAMDAFSVSLANGLNESDMSKRKTCGIAGVFAFFQALMPMLGWFCIHNLLRYFTAFEKFIPWIALALLGFIGAKMLVDGIRSKGETESSKVGFLGLLVQGVATSIDALSVGFTIANYNWYMALGSALIIAAVTFAICLAGVFLGKKFGTKLAGKATVFGGIILILIGIEIFITGLI
ncbi:MAG: manganese efflux pump [Clostridia bacterium]|nr:manganese efflux pump [Clostridia bacterium]